MKCTQYKPEPMFFLFLAYSKTSLVEKTNQLQGWFSRLLALSISVGTQTQLFLYTGVQIIIQNEYLFPFCWIPMEENTYRNDNDKCFSLQKSHSLCQGDLWQWRPCRIFCVSIFLYNYLQSNDVKQKGKFHDSLVC